MEGVSYLASFHAILESLRAGAKGSVLFISLDRNAGPRARQMVEEAIRAGIPVKRVPESFLDSLAEDHRGLVLEVPGASASVRTLEELCRDSKEKSLVLVLDHIEDPHNLGAILRSADAFGASAVLIPSRRAAPLTDAAARSSAGAIAWIPLIQVPNLRMAIERLKEAGYWIYATDMEGRPLYARPLEKKAVLVLGNEGKGVARLLKEAADETLAIPMHGHVESLNVSVSAAIFLYEYRRTYSG